MRNELALREKASIGARFKEILPDITEAMDAIEAQYAEELLNCPHPEGREKLWQAVQVCRKVKAHVGSLAGQGTLALHQIQELSRPKL